MTIQSNLRKQQDRRRRQEAPVIKRAAAPLAKWARQAEKRLAGIVATASAGGLAAELSAEITSIVNESSVQMLATLTAVWDWSWPSATNAWIKAVPGIGGVQEAEDTVADFEFVAPSKKRVTQILNATNAPDGVSAMKRIKTVLRRDLAKLKKTIITGMSSARRSGGASAVKALVPRIQKATGLIEWQALRIARTEGVRIAEAGQDEAREQVSELIGGVEARNSEDSKVRHDHKWFNRKVFKRKGNSGPYLNRGRELPQFPIAPNCRGYTLDVLRDDLTKGIVAAKLAA